MHERPIARVLYAVTALVAATGVVLAFGFESAGRYTTDALERGLFQSRGQSAIGRIADLAMYFTEWSNVLVAIVFALLAIRPTGRGRLVHVLLLDALLMIIVTGVVYNAILAPSGPSRHGWDLATTTIEHTITPILAVVVWAAVGPRGWLDRRLIPPALVVPVIWIVLTLLRGAVIGAYPYGFINVVQLGYGLALLNVFVILLLGIGICFLLLGIERVARRWSG